MLTRASRPIFSLIIVVILCAIATVITAAQTPLPKTVTAPKLRQLSPVAMKTLPACDQTMISPDTDAIFILRGQQLFQLSLIEPIQEKLVGENAAFLGQEFQTTFTQSDRTYLILNSSKGMPFIYEVTGKRLIPLAPYLKEPERMTGFMPDQYYVKGNGLLYYFYKHAQDPRYTSEYIWCWMDLSTGKITEFRFWNFQYTDQAGRLAVFYDESRVTNNDTTPMIGLDIATGEVTFDLFDITKVPYIEDSNRKTHTLVLDDDYDEDSIIGVAIEDKYFNIAFPNGATSTEKIDNSNRFAALHIRYSRDAEYSDADESLWITPLENGAQPKRACFNVQDFVMLDDGYAVYSARTEGGTWIRDTAYLYNYIKHESYNLIDGIGDNIPAASRQFFINTEANVYLSGGFGRAKGGRWAYAEILDRHFDKRELHPLSGTLPMVPRIRKMLLISSQGQRYEINLPKSFRDKVMLHNSGTLIVQSESEKGNSYDLKLFRFNLTE